MTKVLVTGADGFIGCSLISALEKMELSVVVHTRKNGDITDKKTWKSLPVVDHVFHLAACSYVPESWNDPVGFIETNLMGTQMALEYCRKNKSHLIYVSAYIYGEPSRLPIQESDPATPNNPYALSKYLAERTCEFYSQYWDMGVTIVRPFNVFGPRQRPEFLIPEIVKQIRESDEIRVKDLDPRRDYIYIDDVVDMLVKTMSIPQGLNVLNIGSGISYSVRDIINIIQEVAGTNLPVYSEQSTRKQEIADVVADVSKAEKLLGWSPRYTFADGITNLLKVV